MACIMRVVAADVHVAAIGDSITAGSPWDDDPSIGWPAAAAVADRRLRFTVRAVYGKRTDEIADWLEEAATGADVLVVQGGINDIAQGRPVADAAANLGAMVGRGRELGLRVLVADVLPWNNGWPRAEAPIRELNALIARLGAPVLAFHATLEDLDRPGRMREEWTSDGDHPSVEGYRRLGELAFRLP
jgi:lysophospholipase L1-like esterase